MTLQGLLIQPFVEFGFMRRALVACLVSASVATTALWFAGVVQAGALLGTWGTWWLGDTLGVLIGAPLALMAMVFGILTLLVFNLHMRLKEPSAG